MRPMDDTTLTPEYQALFDAVAPLLTAIEQRQQDDEATQDARLLALGQALKAKREQAIGARVNSGFERVCLQSEEAYVGVDDANRGAVAAPRWIKPTTMEGPVLAANAPREREDVRSSIYLRLTARYVDAGASKAGEILLPVDDKAFSLDPTPVPELIKGQQDPSHVTDAQTGQPLYRLPTPAESAPSSVGAPATTPVSPSAPSLGMAPPPGSPGLPPLQTKDLAGEALDLARKKATQAETQIYDWMVETHFRREMRKVIFDAARLGVGILKGPYPIERQRMAFSRATDAQGRPVLGPDGKPVYELDLVQEVQPGLRWVDPWNVFPDPACGEDIHRAAYIFERDFFSKAEVEALKHRPGYRADLIEQALQAGPSTIAGSESRNPQSQKNAYEHRWPIWYYHGTLDQDDLAALNPDAAQDPDCACAEGAPVVVTLINDIPVYAALQPLKSGRLPYHAMPWQRRPGQWWGIGVAEQCQAPQRILNGATRAMLDNAGKSAGSQLIMDKSCVVPADGEWTIGRDKIWYKNVDGTVDDVRKVFYAFEVPNVTAPLLNIIQFAYKLAEESTNIPLITQGQTGATTPETLGATQLQDSNASQLLRNVGYNCDDFITRPLVEQLYEWLLLDPDVPDDAKGDFTIHAHGSSAMVERAIQEQTIVQMSQMVQNPKNPFGVDPKRWFEQWAKSKHLNPKDFQYSDQEQQALDQQPVPPPPQVLVAQINAAVKEQIAQLEAQLGQMKIRQDTHDTQQVQQVRLQELQAQERLAMLQYATQQKISLDEVKAKLADTAMRLQIQKELGSAEMALDLHTHRVPPADRHPVGAQVIRPATEPPGRAPNGEAFAR